MTAVYSKNEDHEDCCSNSAASDDGDAAMKVDIYLPQDEQLQSAPQLPG